ncbi:adenylate cyclase [Amycolatopsis vancoresmycina DSM 44592]|uniref:Adenylate cyclase n=1 Tax=Amycolatopsis vancoresmycina DSM 44592 TaxID=1292037 RepID=R1G1F9_9PSEU|nr:adenylate cyclase [Amycolatopsis vancoresmycina DSM 44592]
MIGDAVNEAARLTELAKAVPSRVLASDAVVSAALPSEAAYWEKHGELELRGRQAVTPTWTLRADPDPASAAPSNPRSGPRRTR